MLTDIDFSFLLITVNLILSAIMSFILSKVYVVCGSSFSNRKTFSKNFYILSMTITLIITVVKTSLALSLGLVGALSIVRYRAAIKEPEELAYLFITIGIGLGIGAEQQLLTLNAFIVILAVILVRHYFTKRSDDKDNMNYNLSIVAQKGSSGALNLENIVKTVSANCKRVKVKRFEDTIDIIDVSLIIEYDNLSSLNKITEDLKKIDNTIKVYFLDSVWE